MKNKLCFKTLDGYIFLRPDDINFVKSKDVYSFVYNDKSRLYVHCTLKDLEEKLDAQSFMRCHRSYLVNVDKVVKYVRASNALLLFENGQEVPISNTKKKVVLQKLGVE